MCETAGCGSPVHIKKAGLCKACYRRKWKAENPEAWDRYYAAYNAQRQANAQRSRRNCRWCNTRVICKQCNLRRPKDGSDYAGPVTLWAVEPQGGLKNHAGASPLDPASQHFPPRAGHASG